MRRKDILIIGMMGLLLSSIVVVWTSENVSALTFTVNSSGGGDFLTISEAVNAASDDDIIQVQAGSGYTENIVINKELTIRGIGMVKPVVSGSSGSSLPVFDIRDRDVTIENLEIDGTGTPSVAGVMSDVQTSEHDNVKITDCTIHDFTNSGYGVCIKRTNPIYPYPTNHVIDGCTIYNCNMGIYISSDPNNLVTYPNHIVKKCEIHSIVECLGTMGQGIYNHGDKNTIEDSEIYYCQDIGLNIYDSYQCDVFDKNTFGHPMYIHDNDVGLVLDNCDDCDIEGYDSGRQLTISENSNNGLYIDNTDNSGFQYIDASENTGYGIFFDASDSNTLRYSTINDNDYVYNGNSNGNYLYMYESSLNTIEDNTIDQTTGTSNLNIVCGSDYNYIDGNTLDGDIFISGDDNTVTDMDFEYLNINSGEDNTIQYCEISRTSGILIDLFEAHDTYINRTELDGVNENDTGINIVDSYDVEISGYKAGESLSTIENCDLVLYVESDDIASSVYFHHYAISDSNLEAYDIELYGTATYSTTGTYNNLNGGPEHYTDEYSTWTYVP